MKHKKKNLTLTELSEQLRQASRRMDARHDEDKQYRQDCKDIAYAMKNKFMLD